jgi:hypothetical protein
MVGVPGYSWLMRVSMDRLSLTLTSFRLSDAVANCLTLPAVLAPISSLRHALMACMVNAGSVKPSIRSMKHTRSKLRGIVRLIHSFAASCGEFDPPWIKRQFGNAIRSRLRRLQLRDAIIKALVYNIHV